MNNLLIRNTKGTILNAENWKEGFIAVDEERHWAKGRSAERLAFDFSNDTPSSGELSLRSILTLFLNAQNIRWNEAIIEHGSVFDSYKRPRMQDLAIWGEADGRTFFIGVEAKVDEPFGSKTIGQQKKYINQLNKTGKNTNADKRLRELSGDFLNETSEKDLDSIRYQLLYYLAGSFREEADIIIMPVFTYRSDKYNPKLGKENYKEYCKFMDTLGFEPINMLIDNMLVAYHKEIMAFDKNRNTLLTKHVYSCYFEK